ncbi:D-2-hydroxyacid dehydrogenase [Bifidobacterium sp. ESL0790]|uniref:D-2-hydroxyacid dehydrogenase n=1 Tax=Bifidobacterium sp. ESL0790 TaxID=2983233 RepID=UPI0023F87938|nr:D-2-hydroxyacid dehydrogenase [Bifidobacterium sp. ESL0790]WEV71833.1 D-2-hydroxyacid dehydrogenase [Bifidobacterium sp. ESL0790]
MSGQNNEGKLIVNGIPVDEADKQRFIEAAGGVPVEFCGTPENFGDMKVKAQIPEELRGKATAVIGNFDPSLAPQFTSLEWLQTWSAGVDAYIAPGVLPASVKVTSATGAYGQSVAEHMIAMMWALMKNLPRYVRNETTHRWHDEGTVVSPEGATALVVGTGDIGSHFARLAKAAGMRTMGVRRNASQPVEGVDEMHGFDELDALLPSANVVAMSLPRAADTHHMFDAHKLGLLGSEAIVINGGRGDAIDLDALHDVLAAGAIRGAGLDVFETEPLPEASPLWDDVNCLITPHVAGGDHLAGNTGRIIDIALANIRRYVAGEPLVDNAHR